MFSLGLIYYFYYHLFWDDNFLYHLRTFSDGYNIWKLGVTVKMGMTVWKFSIDALFKSFYASIILYTSL